jgi:hypothetical protein
MTAESFFHSYNDGSTPVGLCAQACNRTIFPLDALLKKSIVFEILIL